MSLPLIPQEILVLVFLFSALIFASRKQYEHVITRGAIVVFYFWLCLYPDVPMEITRALSRYLFTILAITEITSYITIAIHNRKKL
jgi:hypothetical protein